MKQVLPWGWNRSWRSKPSTLYQFRGPCLCRTQVNKCHLCFTWIKLMSPKSLREGEKWRQSWGLTPQIWDWWRPRPLGRPEFLYVKRAEGVVSAVWESHTTWSSHGFPSRKSLRLTLVTNEHGGNILPYSKAPVGCNGRVRTKMTLFPIARTSIWVV